MSGALAGIGIPERPFRGHGSHASEQRQGVRALLTWRCAVRVAGVEGDSRPEPRRKFVEAVEIGERHPLLFALLAGDSVTTYKNRKVTSDIEKLAQELKEEGK